MPQPPLWKGCPIEDTINSKFEANLLSFRLTKAIRCIERMGDVGTEPFQGAIVPTTACCGGETVTAPCPATLARIPFVRRARSEHTPWLIQKENGRLYIGEFFRFEPSPSSRPSSWERRID